jgi:ABC-type transporter Mla subunit MlaD
MASVDSASFVISLEDGVSGAAESAAKALEGLRASITADTKALSQLQRAQKNLKGSSSVNVEQLKKLGEQIADTKERIAAAQSSVIDLGGTLERGKRPASGYAEAMARMQAQAQGLGGPLGGVAGRLGSIRSLLTGGGSVSLGIVVTAAALALVTAAAVTAGAALLRYGIAQADARRSELLRLEGLTKLRDAWGASAGNAQEMQAAIDRVSASSALGRSEIAGYATQLYKAGLRGENLSHALEVSALQASVLGNASAEAWTGTAANIARAGGSVRKFADQVRARLGGIAAKQMTALTVISEKLDESLSTLYDGVNIDGLLGGLKSVADLFAESTATGQALRVIIGAVFQPFIGGLESATSGAKRFFQGMTIGALDITIAIAKSALWLKRTFGIQLPRLMGDATGALTLGKIAVYGVVTALGAATVAIGLLGVALLPVLYSGLAALAGTVAAGYALAAPFLAAAAAAAAIGTAVYGALKYAQQIDWGSLGRSIAAGIVDGIKSGAKWVLDAITGLADQTMGAFRSALGIRSPSREFAELGVQLPRGVESGIEAGQPSLDRSVSTMVTPPSAPASARQGSQATASRPTIRIEAVNIHTSATDATSIAQDIRAALEDVLSGIQVQIGATS